MKNGRKMIFKNYNFYYSLASEQKETRNTHPYKRMLFIVYLYM